MILNTLPATDNTHRPDPGTYECIEIDKQGREWIVPPRLYCPAPTIVLKDESLSWVSWEEAGRLCDLLRNAYDGWGASERNMDVGDVLEVATRDGYTKIGVAYDWPDDTIEERHYLVRNQHGAHAVVVPVLWDEGGIYLHHIDTSHIDIAEAHRRILRLQADADIQLAKRNGLLCDDGDGPHVQVQLWRSVIWQCTDQTDQIDAERLRDFWRRSLQSE